MLAGTEVVLPVLVGVREFVVGIKTVGVRLSVVFGGVLATWVAVGVGCKKTNLPGEGEELTCHSPP